MSNADHVPLPRPDFIPPPHVASVKRLDRSQPVKDQKFFMEMHGLEDGRRMIHVDNSEGKLQISLEVELQEPENLELLCEKARRDYGTKYNISLYPGEKYDFLRAKFKGMRRGIKATTPDGEWLAKQANSINESLQDETTLMRKKVVDEGLNLNDGEKVAQMCEQQKIKFLDTSFPPGQVSLARSFEKINIIYPWMRATRFVALGGDKSKKPCLYVGKIEPEDIDQGRLGDCYFLCALACLSEFPDLVKAMFLLPQAHDLGVFRVRLSTNGWWQSVVLDEFLPVHPTTKLPVFAQNREEPDELWVAMAEKAYAKVAGSYSAIRAGDPPHALFDLVGLPYERFSNRSEWNSTDSNKMWELIKKCDQDDCIMTLSTPGIVAETERMKLKQCTDEQEKKTIEANLELIQKYEDAGLATGHAFSLLRCVEAQNGTLRLCMVRNPWGDGKEWNGPWSDNSDNWTDAIKKEVGFYEGNDGTFWMAFENLKKWYTDGAISYNVANWYQLRVKAQLQYGVPSIVLKLTTAAAMDRDSVKVWMGAHQADPRGKESFDVDSSLAPVLLCLLKGPNEYGRMDKVAIPTPEAFLNLRDVFCKANLQPNTVYYLVLQGFQDDLISKNFVYSVYCEFPEFVDIDFMSFKEGMAKKFNPVTKFDPEKLERTSTTTKVKRPPVQYQTLSNVVTDIPCNHRGFKPSWGLESSAKSNATTSRMDELLDDESFQVGGDGGVDAEGRDADEQFVNHFLDQMTGGGSAGGVSPLPSGRSNGRGGDHQQPQQQQRRRQSPGRNNNATNDDDEALMREIESGNH